MNVLTTPVSCSISGNMVQWGGAMGLAQFMPNTWLHLGYKERVAAITGQPANPWVIRVPFWLPVFIWKTGALILEFCKER